MQLVLEIPDTRIADLLTGHAGASSPWLHSVNGNVEEGFTVHYDTETDEDGAGSGRWRVSRTQIIANLAAMALGNPYQFSLFLAENDDDLTFDVAWQWIIFGKEVYA